jgi:hypothetical protein
MITGLVSLKKLACLGVDDASSSHRGTVAEEGVLSKTSLPFAMGNGPSDEADHFFL